MAPALCLPLPPVLARWCALHLFEDARKVIGIAHAAFLRNSLNIFIAESQKALGLRNAQLRQVARHRKSKLLLEHPRKVKLVDVKKINGQPLYKAARKGQTVERTPRPITIYDIEYLGSPAPDEYTVRVACSKGTYIRVLAEEIGDALGVPATLSALRRTQAGVFSLAQCHTLPEILAAAESGELETNGWVLPIESVFTPLPALHVNSGVKAHLLNGCPTSHYAAADGRYRTYDETGAFLGLASVEGGVLKVEKLFCERG